jgi:hypothetical protein
MALRPPLPSPGNDGNRLGKRTLGPQQRATIIEMVHMGRQSQADAARLCWVHPATDSRLLMTPRRQEVSPRSEKL